jgi:cytochrome c biogenesis protein CcmG/thiol:disulfide interchange protein DsbE
VKHRSAVIAGIVAVLAIAFVVLLATRKPADTDSTGSAVVGELAPSLTGTGLDGKPFDLDKQRGQWVLVNFFATWCPPCVQEHPELVKFAADHAGSAQVVSVAYGDSADKVRSFFADNGGDWPVLTDSSTSESASLDYGVVKLPESFLVDPAGKVVAKLNGGTTAAQLDDLIAGRTSGGS